MAEVFKTPGVYVVEKSTGANAVVQVETAVPVFIGYTEYAEINGRSFHMKPVMISSMSEYRMFFGGPPKPVFTIKEARDGDVADVNIGNTNYLIEQNDKSTFYLYYSLKFFYENGGADCYIISIGQ
jgi:phage tail sheath protein FI